MNRPIGAPQKHLRHGVPWTESPLFHELLERADLSPEMATLVERFRVDGLVTFDPGVPDELLDAVTAGVHARWPEIRTREVGRVQDAWRDVDAVRELAVWPTILETLEALYQREPLPFQTLDFEFGTEQHSHADSIHFQTHPANWMAGVWIALEDTSADNGALHYVPGSHRIPPLVDPTELGVTADFGAYAAYEEYVEAVIEHHRLERMTLEVRRGTAVVWSANVLHGGDPIRDPSRTRRSQVTHYFFPGVTYYTPMSSEVFRGNIHFRTDDLVDIRTGQPIPHEYKGHPFIPPPPGRRRKVVPAWVDDGRRSSRRDRVLRLAEDVTPPIIMDRVKRQLGGRTPT